MPTARFRLLRSRGFWLLTLAAAAAVGAAVAFHALWTDEVLWIPTNDPRAADLIDQLVNVSHPAPGMHPTATVSAFIGVDESPQFRGGILFSQKPVVHPAMRELVRMGVSALPSLLDHLSDDRKTGLVIDRGTYRGFTILLGAGYDPRFPDGDTYPAPKGSVWAVEEYTLRVGDLCFVAIGQIVNRDLHALQYQPSLMLGIDSPVKVPSLADAVRKDWQGLTAREHRQSLIDDAGDSDPARSAGALERLAFYYPRAYRDVANEQRKNR